MKITLLDVKKALKDGKFRDSLSRETYQDDIVQFLSNPSCSCNIPLYKKILKNNLKELKEYYPNLESPSEKEIDSYKENYQENNWTVINCEISELEEKLRSLGNGKKQISIARWENYVTVIINEID